MFGGPIKNAPLLSEVGLKAIIFSSTFLKVFHKIAFPKNIPKFRGNISDEASFLIRASILIKFQAPATLLILPYFSETLF